MRFAKIINTSLVAVAFLLGASPAANASTIIIDFNNYSVGSLVQAGNPYSGLVNIRAESTIFPEDLSPNIVTPGRIAIFPNPLHYSGGTPAVRTSVSAGPNAWDLDIEAEFLRGVTAFSADIYAGSFQTPFNYFGTDAQGNPFYGSLNIPSVSEPFFHVDILPSAGVSFRGFSFGTGDSVGGGEIALDNLILYGVPETGSVVLLGVGLFFMEILRRKSQKGLGIRSEAQSA